MIKRVLSMSWKIGLTVGKNQCNSLNWQNKGEKNMTTSINTAKAFVKIQSPFMIKSFKN